jgi:hypothetical protein
VSVFKINMSSVPGISSDLLSISPYIDYLWIGCQWLRRSSLDALHMELELAYWGQDKFSVGEKAEPVAPGRDSRLPSGLKPPKPEPNKSRFCKPKPVNPEPSKLKPRKPNPPKSNAKPNKPGTNENSSPPNEDAPLKEVAPKSNG